MTNTSNLLPDSLSALMDAELHGAERELVFTQLLSSPQMQAQWLAYHVVGDVLRSEDLGGAARDLQFWTKLEGRLVQEPTSPQTAAAAMAIPVSTLQRHAESANFTLFKWRAVAGAACTVLLAVLGTLAWAPGAPPVTVAVSSEPVQLVAQDVPSHIDMVAPDGMIRDPRLDQLLSAHQQLGGHSALQMPAGFLRNATYERAGR